jgi:hypothetical protein
VDALKWQQAILVVAASAASGRTAKAVTTEDRAFLLFAFSSSFVLFLVNSFLLKMQASQ